jgi:hypothetical protein
VWNSLHRVVESTSEKPYTDVSSTDPMYAAIRFAKSRNILGDFDTFRPNDPLALDVALIWLYRSRNVADPEDITPDTLSGFVARYPIAMLPPPTAAMPSVTENQLLFLMQSLDEQLATEPREMSLYSEKFNGQGTAFGETFDMNSLTAAHKFLPYNTLVKVTNIDNQKSVTVRINDRGPYVKGRDMDLSLAAFTTIADRSQGVIHATMQRLGDANLVGPCVVPTTYHQRITKYAVLNPGIPHVLHLGDSITLTSTRSFVVRDVIYPDDFTSQIQNWILPGENFSLKPSVVGTYTFHFSSVDGHNREMTMNVVDCGDHSSASSSSLSSVDPEPVSVPSSSISSSASSDHSLIHTDSGTVVPVE